MDISKFLRVSQAIKDYKDRIEEFNIFPVNGTYDNGTYKACQRVVLEATIYPKLTKEEEAELRQLGFSVYSNGPVSTLQMELE